MTVDFKKIRADEFPSFDKAIHLKASGGSPMCRSAYEASKAYLDEMCFEGDLYYDRYLDGVDEARRLVAAYIGASSNEIGFQVNSSSAAAVAAQLLAGQGVERVFFPVGEFPTSVHALHRLGIETVQVGDPGYRDSADAWLDEIDRALEQDNAEKKSALVTSHVCFLNGTTIDIDAYGRFCRKRGLTFVVNATQSFGALEIEVGEVVDMLFATGLKWAAAGYGAGVLYVRQSLIDEVGIPSGSGWLSVDHPYVMDHRNAEPKPCAKSLDAGGGMPHFGPLLALEGALQLFNRIGDGDIRTGIAAVQARTLSMADRLRTGLIESGADVLGDLSKPPMSGIVSLVSLQASDIFAALKAKQILTSLRSFPNTGEQHIVRFGVHFFNTERDVDAALEVVQSVP